MILMDKHSTLAFRVGEEISELRLGPADYWIVYVDKAALNIDVQQQTLHVVSGQIVIISLNNRAIKFSAESRFKGYVLQINDMVSSELVQRYLLLMNTKETHVHVFSADKQEQSIRSVFRNIVAEMNGELEPSETILNLLLQELLARLHRSAAKMDSGDYPNRAQIVSGICTLLEMKYGHSFTLEEIAGKYNMSVSYLSHIFKKITGVSVMRYLLLVRIRAAQEYLSQTALPINEIAEKCGFNDMSNFGRTFRKETGFSPRQYRQAHLQDAESFGE